MSSHVWPSRVKYFMKASTGYSKFLVVSMSKGQVVSELKNIEETEQHILVAGLTIQSVTTVSVSVGCC